VEWMFAIVTVTGTRTDTMAAEIDVAADATLMMLWMLPAMQASVEPGSPVSQREMSSLKASRVGVLIGSSSQT
jgi:hypothetical protein